MGRIVTNSTVGRIELYSHYLKTKSQTNYKEQQRQREREGITAYDSRFVYYLTAVSYCCVRAPIRLIAVNNCGLYQMDYYYYRQRHDASGGDAWPVNDDNVRSVSAS